MPLLWNDEDSIWLNNYEHISKDYVIVRKLFLEIKGKKQKNYNEEFVWKQFRKYGAIESVEVLESSDGWNTNSTPNFEAYVTFANSKNAFFAYMDFVGKEKHNFIVQPANTWHQPTEFSGINLQHLNDDCLLHLFKFCDLPTLVALSETCTKFKQILLRDVFPKSKIFTVDKQKTRYVSDAYSETMQHYGSLGNVRKILKCIGGHINELSIGWNSDTNETHIKRFLQIINRHVGVNIRILSISTMGRNLLTESLMQQIQPVLSRLHTLKISKISMIDLDIQSFCPNLVKLRLQFYSFYSALNKLCRTWPSLTHLSITHNCVLAGDTFNTLRAFLLRNGQIKKLKYTSTLNSKIVLETIAFALHNIERLSIGLQRDEQEFHDPIDTTDFYTSGLQQLANKHTNLKKLCLIEVNQSQITGLMISLQQFENLIELKLTLYTSNIIEYVEIDAVAFSRLAVKLHQLEIILIAFGCLTEAMVLNFVNTRVNLKEFHLHDCKMPSLNELLQKIANTKNGHQHSTPLNRLKLFVDETLIHNSTLELLRKDGIRRYLTVHHGCDHSEVW